MAAVNPWLPDFIALWYDQFEIRFYQDKATEEVDQWRSTPVDADVRGWEHELCTRDPHHVAKEMNEWVLHNAAFTKERLYRSLQAADSAFARMGIASTLNVGTQGWESIRLHWSQYCNLLQNYVGTLLPQRPRPFRWQGLARTRKRDDIRSHFTHFLRWQALRPDAPHVTFNVMETASFPIEALDDRLTIAVVPLIASTSDFVWRTVQVGADKRFRVSIKSPSDLETPLNTSIAAAAEARCDIVVFPELCLTPELQTQVASTTRENFHKHGYPWIVLAGTAPTPLKTDQEKLYNRARMFDGNGDEILCFDKMHRYEMSRREKTRYALDDALGFAPLPEDIVNDSRQFMVVESPVGRIAVLVCEDLTVTSVFADVIDGLGVDWLLVPVMDGCQCLDRWTATSAERYTEHGVSVVIATTMSLYQAHLLDFEKRGTARPPTAGIGLIARPSSVSVVILHPGESHHTPVAVSFIGP